MMNGIGTHSLPTPEFRAGSQSQITQLGRLCRTVLHYRITGPRRDAHHKATTAIANGAERIGIESLNVSGMLKNHRLAKAVSDASLSTFLTFLKDKADRIGVKVVEANRFFPSSKTCSACGAVDSDLSLSDRTYHCSACGHTQDRDLNAAINLKDLAVGHTESINACGDSVRSR